MKEVKNSRKHWSNDNTKSTIQVKVKHWTWCQQMLYHWLVIECQLQLAYIPHLNLYTASMVRTENNKFGLTKGVTISTIFWSTTIQRDLHQGCNSKPNRLKLGDSSLVYSKNCHNTRRIVLNSNRPDKCHAL